MCRGARGRKILAIETITPIRLKPRHKLLLLRQLDRTHHWQSLDDGRRCRCCAREFSGRQIDVIGGTREHGRLRLICPTDNCPSTPNDWAYASGETAGKIDNRIPSKAERTAVRSVRRLAQLFHFLRVRA